MLKAFRLSKQGLHLGQSPRPAKLLDEPEIPDNFFFGMSLILNTQISPFELNRDGPEGIVSRFSTAPVDHKRHRLSQERNVTSGYFNICRHNYTSTYAFIPHFR